MLTADLADSISEDFENVTNSFENVVNSLEVCELSSEESEISLSEKIVMESNEKRLRQRMTSLQTSIHNLKEQLRLEKELWREDIERIRQLQEREIKCTCSHQNLSLQKSDYSSRTSSFMNLGSVSKNQKSEIFRTQSIKQLLELQNYKRKLAETENMCSLELTRVKQSLEDLKTLQSIASEWGKHDEIIGKEKDSGDNQAIQEIYMSSTSNRDE